MELVRFLEWVLLEDFVHGFTEEFGLSRVIPDIGHRALDLGLKRVKCNGENVYEIVLQQKEVSLGACFEPPDPGHPGSFPEFKTSECRLVSVRFQCHLPNPHNAKNPT